MSLIFDGNEKSYEAMLDELTETYTDEDCCECCGSAKATDSGFCIHCDPYIQAISRVIIMMPEHIKTWVIENIDELEELL